MKGQRAGEEQPAFAFYYNLATPWGGTELLLKQEQPCLRIPFAKNAVSSNLAQVITKLVLTDPPRNGLQKIIATLKLKQQWPQVVS